MFSLFFLICLGNREQGHVLFYFSTVPAVTDISFSRLVVQCRLQTAVLRSCVDLYLIQHKLVICKTTMTIACVLLGINMSTGISFVTVYFFFLFHSTSSSNIFYSIGWIHPLPPVFNTFFLHSD